jgi:hypothetical protein
MIERTKARLEEARAPLGKLQAEKLRQVQHANPAASQAFFSLLNDFITKARTVPWVLQSEQKQEYEAWQSSPGAATSPDDDEIFELATQCATQSKSEAKRELRLGGKW